MRSGIVGNQSVPSGLVAYRASGGLIPVGWSEYTSARGRMVVGLPSGGTDGGTVGTALSNVQDKTHSHTTPSHYHDIPYGNDTTNLYMRRTPADAFGNGASLSSATACTISVTSGTASFNYARSENKSAGDTGTAAMSDFVAYIQLMAIKKD
tara:strand:+ start:1080 stop:1535 length:456 start_codon:yes stop_codon:yes gene_type:complete